MGAYKTLMPKSNKQESVSQIKSGTEYTYESIIENIPVKGREFIRDYKGTPDEQALLQKLDAKLRENNKRAKELDMDGNNGHYFVDVEPDVSLGTSAVEHDHRYALYSGGPTGLGSMRFIVNDSYSDLQYGNKNIDSLSVDKESFYTAYADTFTMLIRNFQANIDNKLRDQYRPYEADIRNFMNNYDMLQRMRRGFDDGFYFIPKTESDLILDESDIRYSFSDYTEFIRAVDENFVKDVINNKYPTEDKAIHFADKNFAKNMVYMKPDDVRMYENMPDDSRKLYKGRDAVEMRETVYRNVNLSHEPIGLHKAKEIANEITSSYDYNDLTGTATFKTNQNKSSDRIRGERDVNGSIKRGSEFAEVTPQNNMQSSMDFGG